MVDENSEPGYVQQGLIVGTRKGSLRILRLREEGKKEMDAAAFLNGHPDYYEFVFQ